jgi:hypothetical protein
MKARTIAAVVLASALFAVGVAGAKTAPKTDARVPSLGLGSGAEKLAAQLLEAMKQGEAQTFLRLLDLRALYNDAARTEGQRRTLPAFWAFVTHVHRAAKAEFGSGPDEGFEYRIIGSERQGDETIVTVEFRSSEDGEWQEVPIAFTATSGEWTITVEGMKAFDFGTGVAGPISRGEGTAMDAVREMLEAAKTGDVDAILNHIDLRGMYEAGVPEEAREQMNYEDFEKMTRQAMKQNMKPKPDFEYEIITSEGKGDTATVKVRTKEDKDAEWEETDVPFERIDGKWKITWEGLMSIGKAQ